MSRVQTTCVGEAMFPQNATLHDSSKVRIAIIGAGIAGLSAAWVLHQKYPITIYEKNSYVGGHSNTISVWDNNENIPVDTGFIVYNELNYPKLTKLFDYLGVETQESDMSFGFSDRKNNFEYGGRNLNSLFAQRSNFIRPKHWNMISDILRFYREAPIDLSNGNTDNVSIGDYLHNMNYGSEFIYRHILPMGAAIWSAAISRIASYPAQVFIKFFLNHGLLSVRNRPQWRTVKGGSHNYVKLLTKSFSRQVRFSEVAGVRRKKQKIDVFDQDGNTETFTHVIFATHADITLSLLTDADDSERKAFTPWHYSKNLVALHTDSTLMPRKIRTWSSWNFIGSYGSNDTDNLCVTYWMNRLQRFTATKQIFITLNPTSAINRSRMLGEYKYDHPIFDALALKTQPDIRKIQGHNNTWYCGSYLGHGFHEDALNSGLAVAELLGELYPPWEKKDHSASNRHPSVFKMAAE